MPETSNIAKMAEKLSAELLIEFLWERVGPMNWNWNCVAERHKLKSHSSDVVFYYDNPYAPTRTYVTCDLKSYGANSIAVGAINLAVTSLAKGLACAETSQEWQSKYIHDHVTAEVCGLLFVYNHDGEYDRDFRRLLRGVQHDVLDIPVKSKLAILGPADIFWLNNVRFEIVQMRGLNVLPQRSQCHFFYPNLVRKTNVQPERARAATIEMLTGPWIILSYQSPASAKRRGFVIFFKGRGESAKEFLYLIDYLLHFQVLAEDTDVQIKTLDAHPDAPAFFGKAIDQYIDERHGAEDLKRLVEGIEFSQMNQVQRRFSELQIGMEHV